jgi:7,8-dihydro-6-hydroxymethylpterin-pyrophosphokinase
MRRVRLSKKRWESANSEKDARIFRMEGYQNKKRKIAETRKTNRHLDIDMIQTRSLLIMNSQTIRFALTKSLAEVRHYEFVLELLSIWKLY